MKKSTNQEKYDSHNPLQSLLISRFFYNLTSVLNTFNSEKLLDAGCGEGLAIEETLKRIEKKPSRLVGVDISSDCIRIAKNRFPNLNFFTADIGELPLKDNSFDTVVCLEVLEHINDYNEAIDEIIRVCGKNLIVSVPWEPFFSWANILRGKNVKSFGKDEQHVNYWSKRALSKLFSHKNVIIKSHIISFPWQIIHLECC